MAFYFNVGIADFLFMGFILILFSKTLWVLCKTSFVSKLSNSHNAHMQTALDFFVFPFNGCNGNDMLMEHWDSNEKFNKSFQKA